ncbi:MAG: hypothetical protein OEY44_02485, partial [Candidatus Peregrinibacteria bacterium]|nr:hypothetical protein [Candidatus Peregrinibacteria bacterium]
MHPSKKQKKFGENRLTFFSEVPNLSRGDVQSVEAKKEKKVEEKLDAEGNVVRKGREAATWSVDDLVSKSNVTIAKHRTALAELPQGFNDRLRSAISQYIKNSPQNFDKDEYRGLGNTEYRRFSDAMHSKVRSLVEQYAPTQSEINEKKEAQRKMKEAKKAAKEIQQVSLKDIQDDPGDIEDLPTLSKKYEAYESWNESLQDQAGKVMAGMGKFQARFQEFQQARSGLQAYKKFANFFSGDDAEMIALKSLKAKHEATTKATIEKIRAAQKKLDSYGKEMAKASNEQKEEKMEERDERLRQIEENASLSKKEKKVRKAQFEKVKGDKEVLTT